ncbi:MAG: hypothetical protein JXR63_03135, partial [Spirochaetales bacterium]|nr:hypothetical protein [Spirochaetales bacterium]
VFALDDEKYYEYLRKLDFQLEMKYIEKSGYDQGLQEGKLEGLLEGEQKGLLEGKQAGRLEGILEGKQEGLLEGKQEGILEGKQEGILEGKQAGLLEGEQKGQLNGKTELLYKLLVKKFSFKKSDLSRILKDSGNYSIDELFDFAMDSNSFDEFLGRIK